MGGIGAKLRAIRRQWQLSLREVEKRSLHLAREKKCQSYQVSASWLDRLEREEHELSVSKLMVLAEIYNVSPGQLLRCVDPGRAQNLLPAELTPQIASLVPGGQPLDPQTKSLLPDTPQPSEDETRLIVAENDPLPAPYRRGIIGKRDLTLDPMVAAGSIVQIDTRNRAISTRRDWTHEFARPIYFLMTRNAYVCGWCELDTSSGWLTLIPHSLSPAPSRRWRFGSEIESVGRVIAVAIPLESRVPLSKRERGVDG